MSLWIKINNLYVIFWSCRNLYVKWVGRLTFKKEMNKEFYTAEEASKELNIHVRKVYYLRDTGVIKGSMQLRNKLSTAKCWKLSKNELEMLRKNLKET